MIDREKVIRAFEQYVYNFVELTTTDEYNHQILEQVLVLLKEQEAVEPYVTGRGETFETAETWWYACGNCHEALDVNDKYCRHCGRPVKWE